MSDASFVSVIFLKGPKHVEYDDGV